MLADLQEESERAAAGGIKQAAPRPWRALPPEMLHTASKLNASTYLLIPFVRRRKAAERLQNLYFVSKRGLLKKVALLDKRTERTKYGVLYHSASFPGGSCLQVR